MVFFLPLNIFIYIYVQIRGESLLLLWYSISHSIYVHEYNITINIYNIIEGKLHYIALLRHSVHGHNYTNEAYIYATYRDK